MASLFETLIKEKYINKDQLEEAKKLHQEKGIPIQNALIDLQFIVEELLLKVISQVCRLPITNLEQVTIDSKIAATIPPELCKRYGIFPIKRENNIIILAMSNPQDIIAIDDIRALLDCPVRPALCSKNQIDQCIAEYHQNADDLRNLVVEERRDDEGTADNKKQAEGSLQSSEHAIKVELSGGQRVDVEDLNEDGSPTVKLINLILVDAIKVKASDIHLEPREDCLEVRYRIDGDLKNIMRVPKNVHHKMVARLKILSKLDITQDIKPQDGRLHLMVNGRKVDFRISTIPTYYGEKVVARILDAKEAKTSLDNIGFQENQKQMFIEAIKRPQGMVLVTGPTGSGKTSSLYAGLNFVRSETTNIVTIEDPIEFLIEGINQIQINPQRGVTFASGLRSILRQDPNVILVGEIRDQETAEIAMKASLTGHLVLSTLHTNSAIATITRLIDIGLDNYLVGSGVILVASQRLVKTICTTCKTQYQPDEIFLNEHKNIIDKFNIKTFYKGEGCPKCGFNGFSGRTGVFEVLPISEKMRDMISSDASEAKLRKIARKEGFKFITECGIEKAMAGITTLDELKKTIGKLDFIEPEDEVDLDEIHGSSIAEQISKENLITPQVNIKITKEDLLKNLAAEEAAQKNKNLKGDINPQKKPISQKDIKEKKGNLSFYENLISQIGEEDIQREETKENKLAEKKPIFTGETTKEHTQNKTIKPDSINNLPPNVPNEPKELKNQPKEIAVPEPEPVQAIIETKKQTNTKPTILIAEDERDIQKILTKVLETSNYNVIVTNNGKEAVVSAFRNKPNLIIMDFMMPEMNGFEAVEILRSQLETAVIPIIMLTADTDKETEEKSKIMGIDKFLTKPFNRQELTSTVDMLIKQGNLKNILF